MRRPGAGAALAGAPFGDRGDAGRQLAAALRPVLARTAPLPTVLVGLPRGGLVVAAAAASDLGLPVDVLAVRKIGAPANPELALGAVTAGPPPWQSVLLNEQLVLSTQLTTEQVGVLVRRAQALAAADDRTYRSGRPPLQVAGRQVVFIDDGAATGATIRAAVAAGRAASAERVVVGLPVAPRDTLAVLSVEADEVVCLRQPLLFRAVGWAYRDFAQVDTAGVLRLLGGGP